MNYYYLIPALFLLQINAKPVIWFTFTFGLIAFCKYNSEKMQAKQFIQGEQYALGGIVKDESAEWLNIILKKFWVFYEPTLCENIRKETAPLLRTMKNKLIQKIELGTITFGKNAPYIICSRVLSSDNNRIVLDCVLGFIAPDLDFVLNINYLPFAISQVFFRGRLRVEADLVPEFPHVQTCLLTFLEKPVFSFDLVPLKVNLMNIPGIAQIISELINKEMNKQLLYPARKIIQVLSPEENKPFKFSGVLLVKIKTSSNILSNLGIKLHSNISVFNSILQKDYIYPIIIDENINIDIVFINIYNNLLNSSIKKTIIPLPLQSKETSIELFSNVKLNLEMELITCCPDSKDFTHGVLEIIIHKAKDILPVNFNGMSDPYCIIYNGEVALFKTIMVRNTLAPTWNQSFQFVIQNVGDLTLSIKMFDHDDITLHKQIGCLELSFSDANNFNVSNKWYPIEKGYICLSTKFYPVKVPEGWYNYQTIVNTHRSSMIQAPIEIVKSCVPCIPSQLFFN